jgi:hypothetical protein
MYDAGGLALAQTGISALLQPGIQDREFDLTATETRFDIFLEGLGLKRPEG